MTHPETLSGRRDSHTRLLRQRINGSRHWQTQVFAVMSLLLLTICMSVKASAQTTLTVSRTNMQNWLFYNDETDVIDNTLGSFVPGPATTPLGAGSAQISVSGTQRRNLATYQFSGTPLASITTLKFSTYNPSAGNGGSANRSGYLHFNVDFNGSDTFQRRLVFVPSSNGTVIQNSWQEWDAINGGNALWSYSGATWPVTGQPGTTLKTWNQILADYPGVRIRVTDAFVGIRVGEPYANGYTENIDAFKFGTGAGTTYFDFEPAAVTPAAGPTSTAHSTGRSRMRRPVGLWEAMASAAIWTTTASSCQLTSTT